MIGNPRAKAYNDHNVYLLGAGFGADAGLPLIKDFMNRMRDAAAWLEAQGGREREREAIARVLEFRLRASAAAHRVPLDVENVEELFSLASASGDEDLARAMPLAIGATLEYARETAKPVDEWHRFQIGVLNLPDWKAPSSWASPLPYVGVQINQGVRKGRWHSCPPYDFYVGVMSGYFGTGGRDRRDTIITFNYDLLIEETLGSLGVAFHYGCKIALDELVEAPSFEPGRGRLSVLKLHGSLNWVSTDDYGARRVPEVPVDEVVRGPTEFERKGWGGPGVPQFVVYSDYCKVLKQNLPPLLLPPSWRKPLAGALSEVWDAAVSAVRTATNVIILGYSIPQTDIHFKYLLAAGLQDNISLRKVFFVNPALRDENQRRTLEERLLGISGLFRPELREQGVIELIAADAREFFTGPHDISARESYRERIGRPLNPETYTGDDAPFRFSDRPESLGSWR
jgi:hypothetical protein